MYIYIYMFAFLRTDSLHTARAEEANSSDFELREPACRWGVSWRDHPRR